MNQIITIGREFGSGGRELGRRLAEELGVEYYDKEIVEQIAAHTSFSEEYVHQIMEGKHHRLYPITVNHTFNFAGDAHAQILSSVFQAQYQILKNLAQLSSCVIVGRCADYLLRSYSPQRLFVYADMESRVKRCMERNDDSHRYSEREIERLMTAEVLANHVSRPCEKLNDGAEHGSRPESPDVEKILAEVFHLEFGNDGLKSTLRTESSPVLRATVGACVLVIGEHGLPLPHPCPLIISLSPCHFSFHCFFLSAN